MNQFRNCLLVEQPNGDFGRTIARQYIFSTWQYLLYQQLARSTDPRLAEIAAKALKETTYHAELAAEWVVRLGDGREIEFGLWHLPDRLVRPGDVLVNLPQKMRLHCLAPDRFELEFWDSGLIHVFQVFKHDRPSPAGTPRARLMEITTRTRDHAIRLTYSLNGDLDTVVDSGGRTLTFEHDALGRLTSVLLPVPHGPGLVRRRTC